MTPRSPTRDVCSTHTRCVQATRDDKTQSLNAQSGGLSKTLKLVAYARYSTNDALCRIRKMIEYCAANVARAKPSHTREIQHVYVNRRRREHRRQVAFHAFWAAHNLGERRVPADTITRVGRRRIPICHPVPEMKSSTWWNSVPLGCARNH